MEKTDHKIHIFPGNQTQKNTFFLFSLRRSFKEKGHQPLGWCPHFFRGMKNQSVQINHGNGRQALLRRNVSGT